MTDRPFISCFETPGGRYVYDINSNGIFQVSPIVYELLSIEAREGNVATLDGTMRERFGSEIVDQAWREILDRQEEGFFSCRRPSAMRLPIERKFLTSLLQDKMRQLTLCVTESCNLRCSYCIYGGGFSGYRRHSPQRMKWSVAKKAIDVFLERSGSSPEVALGFYGGEPLSYLSLLEKAAQYARSRRPHGLQMSMTTNGTLLQGKAIDFVTQHEIQLTVSLDGPVEIHDAARTDPKGRGTHEAVMRNLTQLRNSFPDYYRSHVRLSITYTRVQDLLRIRNFFAGRTELFGDTQISVNRAASPDENSDLDETEYSLRASVWKQLATGYMTAIVEGRSPDPVLRALYTIDLARIHHRPQNFMPEVVYPNGICFPGVQRVFCTVDGRFFICERVSEGFEIGHVDHGISAEASIGFVDQYSAVSERKSQCLDCPAVRFCKLCFSQAMTDGTDIQKSRRACVGMRANIEHMMSVYCAIGEKRPEALQVFDTITV